MSRIVIGSRDVVDRYVEAIFQLAQETGNLPKFVKDFEKLRAVIEQSGEALSKLASPILNLVLKEKIINDLAKSLKLTDSVTNFLILLVRNNRFSLIDIIVDAFFTKYNQSEGVQEISIVSATVVSEKMRKKIEETVKVIFGSKLELSFEENPELLGGLVIKSGSLFYDASIKGKLEKLEKKTDKEILNMQ